ncbi:MAG TPA: hypothetical protein VFD38_08150 [Myxococcaceae bacterium]|nr:hypothetical protein [Myxococcaceae bacterium]
MANDELDPSGPVHDRALLLHGPRRARVLTLEEIQRYGRDSFGDPDYVSIYGMPPREWYARGVRLLGRTAVECTRDVLADAIGRDLAAVVERLSPVPGVLVIDLFAGSCNTLSWILHHLRSSEGLAFELDPGVFALSRDNLAILGSPVRLLEGDYLELLEKQPPSERGLLFFVAPPWGTALDERAGLDLRRTQPPVPEIIDHLCLRHPGRPMLFAVQVYEKLEPASLAEVEARLDWATFRVYGFNAPGRNHGLLLGARGWAERPGSQ